MCVCFLCSYPDRTQLQTIYSAYLSPVLQSTLGNHPTWSSAGKIHQLAGSLVQIYEQVCSPWLICNVFFVSLYVCMFNLTCTPVWVCVCVFQVKAKFTIDEHSHYLFTPCVLTQWVLNLLRYDLTAGECNRKTNSRLAICCHFVVWSMPICSALWVIHAP